MNENQKSGLAAASLVLGIIGLIFSIIPIINNAAFVMGLIGLVLGIIGLVKKNKKGIAIAGVVLCVLAMIVTFTMQAVWKKALDQTSAQVSENLDNISGDNTDELLGKSVQVDMGDFTMSEDKYGLVTSTLPVTVKNLTDESKSFSIQFEAVAADGSRIKDDYVYANGLGAGQSQSFTAFTYVGSDEKEAMKTATFKIVKVSMI